MKSYCQFTIDIYEGCHESQFECKRGINVHNPATNCISSKWYSDGYNDCSDGSHETTATNYTGI